MPRGGVLAGRGQRALAEAAHGLRGRLQARDRLDVREAQPAQVWKVQRPLLRDVAERVAALVAVGRRVRHLAYAHAIEHDPDDSRERHYLAISPCLMVGALASALRMRAVSCSTNVSGRKPSMRLTMRPA